MTINITRVHAALLAALAVAVVASVGWAAIPSANGTISACKNANGALKVIDKESGVSCPSNQQLLQWSTLGTAGSGVAGLQYVTNGSTTSSSTWRSTSVECPAGKKAVGGGAEVGEQQGNSWGSPAGVALSSSRPLGPEGWGAVAQEIVPTSSYWKLIVWAVCATA